MRSAVVTLCLLGELGTACGARSELLLSSARPAPTPAADCTPRTFARALAASGTLHVSSDQRGRPVIWGARDTVELNAGGQIVAEVDAHGELSSPLDLSPVGVGALGGVAFGDDDSLVLGARLFGPATLEGTRLDPPADGGLLVAKLDPTRHFIWAKSISRAGRSYSAGVAIDHEGNVLVEGLFAGTLDFGPSATAGSVLTSDQGTCLETFVAKLDQNGQLLWAKVFSHRTCLDSSNLQFVIPSPGAPVAFASDGSALVAAWGHSGDDEAGPQVDDPFLLKLDRDGNLLWRLSYPGFAVDDLAVDGAGNISLSGHASWYDVTIGSITLPVRGLFDWLIARISQDGRALGGRRFGAPNVTTTASAAFDALGNGWGFAAFNSYPGLLSQVDVGGFSVGRGSQSGAALVSFDSDFLLRKTVDFGVVPTPANGHTELHAGSGLAVDPCFQLTWLGALSGSLDLGAGNALSVTDDGAFLAGQPAPD